MDDDAPDRKQSSDSLRGKFVAFCIAEDCIARRQLPLFPLNINKLLSYALWLPDNGVNSWASVRNYISAAVGWATERSTDDCRTASRVNEQLFARFRVRFQSDVPLKRRRAGKLAMRPEIMEAMALQTNLRNAVSVGEQACYLILYFSSIRIGHVAPAKLLKSKHVLTWGDVIFFEAEVFIYLRSTKTRRANADDGFWTVVAARPGGLCALDPVRMLRLWRTWSYVCDSQPVFPAVAARMLAQTRPCFTASLRKRVRAALPLLPHGHLCDVSRLSGISFRKSGITQLWDKIPRHRLAEHASHASFSSTPSYGGDSFAVRRTNTAAIAAGFSAGF